MARFKSNQCRKINEVLRQAIGRELRGDPEVKGLIIEGNEDEIRKLFDSYPQDFPITFNIMTYRKDLTGKGRPEIALQQSIEFLEKGFLKGQALTEDILNAINKPNRNEEIMNRYHELCRVFINENNKQPKDKDIIPIIVREFGITDRHFRRIKGSINNIEK